MAVHSFRPNGDLTVTGWTVTPSGTNWAALDDDPNSPNTSDYTSQALSVSASDYTIRLNLDAPPVGFAPSAISQIQVRIYTATPGLSDDSLQWGANIVSSGGTAWSTLATTSYSGGTGAAFSLNTTINATGQAADWSDACVHLQFRRTTSMGADSITQQVMAVEVDVTYTPTFTGEQKRFRFYNDDGPGSGATAYAAEDTNISLVAATTKHLRVQIQETAGGGGATTDDYPLYYSRNGGAWTAVTTSDTYIRGVATSFSNTGDTFASDRLTAGTGTALTGELTEDGTITDRQITASNYAELVYVIQCTASCSNGDTFDFRVYRNGAVINTYTATPRITFSLPTATIEQSGFRFYANDAAPATATALAAEDTSINLDELVTFQLRTQIQETAGTGGAATDDYKLYVSKNGGAYSAVTMFSGDVYIVANSNFADGDAVSSARLTAGAGSFINGVCDENAEVTNYTLSANSYTEFVWSLEAQASAVPGDTYDFRVYRNGSAIDTYTLTPRLTIVTALLTQQHYRWYNDDGSATTSTAAANEDTAYAPTLTANKNLHLRVQLQETAGMSTFAGADYQLQYRVNAGSWTDLTTGTSDVQAYNSANLTDGAAVTTSRLTAGTGSFGDGEVGEGGLASDRLITASTYTELIYTVRLVYADLVDDDLLEFRVLLNGAPTNMTYTVTPTVDVTITNPNPTLVVADTANASTTDAVALTQDHTLAGLADTANASTTDAVVLTQAHTLVGVADTANASTTDAVTLTTFNATLSHYRWYNDDGTATTSTAAASEDTAFSSAFNVDKPLHLRVQIQNNTALGGTSTLDWQLQYRLNSGTWTDVTTSSSHARAFASTNLTDGGTLATRLTAGTGSAATGEVSETGLLSDRGLAASSYMEFIYAVRLEHNDLNDGDLLEFQVLLAGSTDNITYSATPTVNVDIPSFTQTHYRWYNDDGTESASTPSVAEDTPYTASFSADTNQQLRIQIQNGGAIAAPSTDDWRLQYRINAGAWTELTTTSTGVRAFSSSFVFDGNGTTGRLTAGSGSFSQGEQSESGTVTDRSVSASNYTEFLYTVAFDHSDLSTGDDVEFRITRNYPLFSTAPAMVYSVTPALEVTKFHVLVVADTANDSTTDAVALTQDHTLAVADTANASTADAVVLNVSVDLTVADTANDSTTDAVTLTQAHALTVADTANASTTDAVVLTQDHVLVVADTANGSTTDAAVLTQAHTLAGLADTANGSTADAVTLTQAHALTISDTANASTTDAVTLTQVHVLAVADTANASTTDAVVLTQAHTLAVADTANASTADAVVLSQAHTLAGLADTANASTTDAVVLTQAHALVVADTANESTTDDAGALTQVHVLVVADTANGSTADSVNLTLQGDLEPADTANGSTADAVVLTQLHILVVADTANASTADAAPLTQDHQLAGVADTANGSTTDAAGALTQVHNLTVADTANESTTDAVTLTIQGDLVVADTANASTTDSVVLTQVHELAGLADTANSSTTDAVVLTQAHVLTVADTANESTADSVTLSTEGTLGVSDTANASTTDAVVLTQTHQLAGIADTANGSTTDSVMLTQVHSLVVSDTANGSTTDTVVIAVTHILVVADTANGSTADSVVLVVEGDLVVADTANSSTTDTVVLTQVHFLVVADTANGSTTDTVSLSEGGEPSEKRTLHIPAAYRVLEIGAHDRTLTVEPAVRTRYVLVKNL